MALTVLVTGAAGFIGMHTCLRLLAAGHRVVGLDNLNTYYSPALKQARLARLQALPGFVFIRADLADTTAVAAAFAAVGLDWRRHVVRDPKLVRPTEIERGRADTRRASERLGWTARHAMPDVVQMMVEARVAEQPATRRAARRAATTHS